MISRCFAHVMSHFNLLTLNFYGISIVMRLNSAQNMSEIEESTAELLTV